MKILFDHNVPRRLRNHLEGHEIHTAKEMKWEQLKNGALIAAAVENGFQAFVTIDKQLEYQQNLAALLLPVVVLDAKSNTLPALLPFVEHLEWTADQKALLKELARAAEQSATGAVDERQEVADAIRKSLHRLTLRQGVFRLLDRLGLAYLKTPWDDLYAERSTLVHGLAPKPGADYGDLAHRTVSLCGRILLEAHRGRDPDGEPPRREALCRVTDGTTVVAGDAMTFCASTASSAASKASAGYADAQPLRWSRGRREI